MKPVISDDGSATAYSDTYHQTYHSTHGAQTESQVVYLQNSGVEAALQQGNATAVLEVGFGLGLNFLLTAACALKNKSPLTYTALEHDLISVDTFRALAYGERISGAAALVDALAAALAHNKDGDLHLQFDTVTLSILIGDARQAALPEQINAVYQDAFSPDANPELWTGDFLQRLCLTLRPGGTLTSYCVKGDVRRGLRDCGMTVQKLPGPPGKREVLLAVKPG